MNLLYSILMYGRTPDLSNYYRKVSTVVVLSERQLELRKKLFGTLSDDEMAFVSCFVCWLCFTSDFQEEFRMRDAMNTYSRPSKHADTILGNSDTVASAYLPSYDTCYDCRHLLDADLREYTDGATWITLFCACCLQLVRWNNV